VTGADRQILVEAQEALLQAMLTAARAAVAISALIVADKAPERQAERPPPPPPPYEPTGLFHPKPGPPKERS